MSATRWTYYGQRRFDGSTETGTCWADTVEEALASIEEERMLDKVALILDEVAEVTR